MAISITNPNRGTATEKVSDQDLTLVPAANLAAGSFGLLSVVIDNTGTAEGETNDLSVTDSQGHTWVKLREQTEANTAALTGVTGALFLGRLTNGLTTSDTVSIASAAASTGKGAQLSELACAGGFRIVLSAGGANGTNEAAATTYSVVLSGLTNVPGLYVGQAAAEGEAVADVTKDTAYTACGGSYGSGSAGIGESNVIASLATLANTSTGDTFDATGLNARDRATILVRLEEEAEGGLSATIGLATEAHTAQPLAQLKAVPISAPAETNLALALGSLHALALGLASETNLAQALAAARVAAIARATEADVAQALGAAKAQGIGQATETDLAQTLAQAKVAAIGRATETDTALAITALLLVVLTGKVSVGNVRLVRASADARHVRATADARIVRAKANARSL